MLKISDCRRKKAAAAGGRGYCRQLSAVGLTVTSECEGEARTIISMFSRLLDRINSEGAGVTLCAKSVADSWRVGA